MKGLLLKDIFAIRKQAKILLVFVVVYSIYAIMVKNISMLGGMVVLMCAMMPITTMSFDEFCKWDKYALSMPVSRKTMVLSKYILGIILDLAGLLVLAPISAIVVLYTKEMKISESLLILLVIGEVAITFISIILPILFKFGVEKGRMYMMIVVFAPTILGLLLSKTGVKAPSEQTIKLLLYASPFAVIAILLLSIQLSIGIYNKKEF